jgi:hypothetical protein
MKTITIGRDDARNLDLPAGVEVQIKLSKRKFWEKAHEVYREGVYQGTTNLERPEGINGKQKL